MCCDDTQDMPAEFGREPHLMQLLQVCSTWYNTIMTTPSLWANIAVDLALADPRLTSPDSQLSRFLARSGNCPLTIKLTAWIGRGHSSLELLGLCSSQCEFNMYSLNLGFFVVDPSASTLIPMQSDIPVL
jgi:hypothetical protein